MQVNTTISVELPDSTTLDEVEKVLADELRRAGQRLLIALCQELEAHVLTRAVVRSRVLFVGIPQTLSSRNFH